MRTRNTKVIDDIDSVPLSPGIYAMFSVTNRSRSCAYVGQASNLRRRLRNHLIERNSSVSTGVNAVSMNMDLITEVDWWLNGRFHNKIDRSASEIIAFEALQPNYRTRERFSLEAQDRASEPDFWEELFQFFNQVPNGRLVRPGKDPLELRIETLELRVEALENLIQQTKM